MEHSTSLLLEILAIMGAAVIFVPLAHKLKLSVILGYLAAGAIVGPWGLGIVHDVDNIRHIAEFGVVFLLFLIGIEMKPSRLWLMRRQVFGLGGGQVLITGAIIGVAAWVMGVPLAASVVVGLGLALSSTAMGLQILAERHELATTSGRSSFAILLLQDLMVPVLLTMIPLLAAKGIAVSAGMGLAVLEAVGVLGAAIIGGRLLLRPLLRAVAATGSAEVFTATALLVVLGMAWAMEMVGLSMALGAFIAGLLLADSEFRHQVEADIQPFRGLLLGLFFMAVGMMVDFGLLVTHGLLVAGLVVALMGVKAAMLFGLARGFGLSSPDSIKTAGLLSQGGEFAFVLFSFAVARGVLPEDTAQLLVLVVSISMALTPLMVVLAARMARRMTSDVGATQTMQPLPETDGPHVVIAGFGRVGRTVATMLGRSGIPCIAFDADLEQVMRGRKDGFKVYFGDASRAEVLKAAHADRAALIVITMDDPGATARTVSGIRHHHPNVPIHARARDLDHARILTEAGVTLSVPETLEASLQLGKRAMAAVNVPHDEIIELLHHYREGDYTALKEEVSDQK